MMRDRTEKTCAFYDRSEGRRLPLSQAMNQTVAWYVVLDSSEVLDK